MNPNCNGGLGSPTPFAGPNVNPRPSNPPPSAVTVDPRSRPSPPMPVPLPQPRPDYFAPAFPGIVPGASPNRGLKPMTRGAGRSGKPAGGPFSRDGAFPASGREWQSLALSSPADLALSWPAERPSAASSSVGREEPTRGRSFNGPAGDLPTVRRRPSGPRRTP